jgi:hypothetical protein
MLVDGPGGAGDRVTNAIRSASRTTGANFDYLLRTAMRESSLNPSARARTSSACGLYQFIESTWLAMVKEEGPKFGLGNYAAAIERSVGGEYTVRDPQTRAHILKLREDPEISSVMAGALARRNAHELSRTLGRKPTKGELYLAHFLGAGGAKRLIQLQRNNPNASAAAAFPEAARANQTIFHHKSGRARSASEVFAVLTGRHDKRPTPLTVANLRGGAPAAAPHKPNPAAPRAIYAHPINPRRSSFVPEDGAAFQALFRDGSQTQAALSPAVRELWGAFDTVSRLPAEAASAKNKNGAVGEPLDLLSHMRPGIRRRAT